jgi:hypothetical protein
MTSESGRHRRPAVTPAAPPSRRPSRVAIATAGGTGALALAVALVTVAAGPARNGDPGATRNEAAPPVTSVSPSSAGPDSPSIAIAGGTSLATYTGAQRTALPLPPSSTPPRVAPTQTATAHGANGKRNAYGHHRATPTPTPTGSTEATPDVTAPALPTVGLPLP